MENLSNSVLESEVQLRGRVECPICGRLYDDHVKGECPENIKEQLALTNRVLARYNMFSSRMKMASDIARLDYWMSLYRGLR